MLSHEQFRINNFASKDLKTTIHSSAICSDGYEVKNLIDNHSKAMFYEKKGFMAEYYIKCPVEIFLTFPYLIDISSIKLDRKCFSHWSKCIEIHTAFQKPTKQADDAKKELSLVDRYQYLIDFSDDSQITKHRDLFHMVGKYNENRACSDKKSSKVCFSIESSNTAFSLKRHPSLRSCSNLMIRITWATIAVLNNLEIWGTVSRNNPKELIKEALMLIEMKRDVNIENIVQPHQPKDIKQTILPLKHSYSTEEIPKEFIDPITFSIMTVPMLLPSGNSVDQTTLQKFVSEEEKYGRLPSDPFTGIVFHGDKQAIPNVTLKSRIDAFLLKNSEFYNICDGATTGSKNLSCNTLNNMKMNNPNKRKFINISRTSETNSNNFKVFDVDYRKNKEYVNSSKSKKLSHDAELKDSLEHSLFKTLSVLPVDRILKPKIQCAKCNSTSNLYKLLCLHYYCRKCLNDFVEETKKCQKCNKEINRNDVTKYH